MPASRMSSAVNVPVITLGGATPVFVYIDEHSYNICPSALSGRIEEVASKGELTPRAIIAVDLFGLPADYTRITPLAEEHGLVLVEDAAQSFGGALGDRTACSFGAMAAMKSEVNFSEVAYIILLVG